MGRAGIETRAGGQLFRSRLEARWATFFDLTGVQWTYEPFDAVGYIPDFLIHGGSEPFVLEVKPYYTFDECATELRRIQPLLWEAGHKCPVLVVGCSPVLPLAALNPDHWHIKEYVWPGKDIENFWREAGNRSRWSPS